MDNIRTQDVLEPGWVRYDHDYRFPRPPGIEPMINQRKRFNFWINNPNGFDFSEMSTGKTYTAIWAADYLQRQVGGSVLVLTPLSTLYSVWERSLSDILGDVDRYNILPQSGAKKSRLIASSSGKFFVSNYECVLSNDVFDAIQSSDIHTVIVDECTAFKRPVTARLKAFRLLAHPAGRERNVWMLSATPIPNTPLNAYGIARAAFSRYSESFTRYRDRTHIRKDMWTWVPKPDATRQAYDLLQPSIRILRSDCVNIPESTTTRRDVKLSTEAASLYRTLKRDTIAELASGRTVNSAHEAALRNKLLQVCGGAVYSEGGKSNTLDLGTRWSELLNVIEESDEKFVLMVPYRNQLMLLVDKLKKEGISVVAMHGDVKPKERGRLIQAFQGLPHPYGIVADPRTLAHGVELYKADKIIWWLPVDSNEIYQQAIGRLTRRGQVNHVTNFQLCGTPLEARIYDKLEARERIQGVLLKALTLGERPDVKKTTPHTG